MIGLSGIGPARADGPKLVQVCREQKVGLFDRDYGPYRVCYWTVVCEGSCIPGDKPFKAIDGLG